MTGLSQHPAPGERLIKFCGDTITFTLKADGYTGGRARLRTNLGWAQVRNEDIVRHVEEERVSLARDWHDLPMEKDGADVFSIVLPLADVGCFEAKAYLMADDGVIEWPEGDNTRLQVEPAETCAGNTMYTAFVRLFGHARFSGAVQPHHESAITLLDEAGYTVLPPSGTFRDLVRQLDFIVGTLRCRIVQLLPIHPTPTTYARMGRFGSPFATLDLMDVDPALAEFDRTATPLDQFQELVDAVHRRNARLYLDVPINHTGWASHLQNHHPEWYVRSPTDGSFTSPGAWGTLWRDLSKLDYHYHEMWQYMAGVFLFWCRRGVDGFRCDAGYKIPFEAWQYMVAKVRMEYPCTIFMLEGLGGDPAVTEHLLADSGMNWAYSEIFQNHDRAAVKAYLPGSLRVSATKGNLIHFAETHDNARLAAQSDTFARLRVAFCALTAHNGAFGFSNGVEWFATEKINVHNAHSLNWGAPHNQIEWIRRIHALTEIHPAFHAGADVELVTSGTGNTAAVLRADASGRHRLLVLANFDTEQPAFVRHAVKGLTVDLLDRTDPGTPLAPGQVRCLTDNPAWRRRIAALLETPFTRVTAAEEQRLRAKMISLQRHLGGTCPESTAPLLRNPRAFCETLAGAPCATVWRWPTDRRRRVMLPPGHVLLVQAEHSFIAEYKKEDETLAHEKSFALEDGRHAALIEPLPAPVSHNDLLLKLILFEPDATVHTKNPLLQLAAPGKQHISTSFSTGSHHHRDCHAICTNRHGALAHVRIGWARLLSKYDGFLQANLNPDVPVNRHIMLTRCRAWIVCCGYSTELAFECQTRFSLPAKNCIVWEFSIPVGQGQLIQLSATLRLHPDRNALCLNIERARADRPGQLTDDRPVELILRTDLEDRTNHATTRAHAGPEAHWPTAIEDRRDGFTFAPAIDRRLQVQLLGGGYYPGPEWYYQVEHPVDRSRGLEGTSDLFSPGYFKRLLSGGQSATLLAGINRLPRFAPPPAAPEQPRPFEAVLAEAMQAFIVKHNQLRTVIAGYPWFLDWGRDTLICLRGIIAADMLNEAEAILLRFARSERGGTLPNMICGNDDENRETSDAPLWLFVACSELMRAQGHCRILESDCGGRTLKDILISIARGCLAGTENGISTDPASGLLFSPPHFTWMDTNYPAGTPRQGYPVEIQVLWHYALRLLAKLDRKATWKKLSAQVADSIRTLYRIERGRETYLADNLAADSGVPAANAIVDDALRPNQLFAITLGTVVDGDLAQGILHACEQLLIPGAIRSLADRPVEHPAPVYHNGELLNDPHRPYQGRYEGDEDRRRKPAYHNGTAWSWLFPAYPEALFMLYGEAARETALALLSSSSLLLESGCLCHIPEILDGNAPHNQRGCGAQAWGTTELFRVIRLLKHSA